MSRSVWAVFLAAILGLAGLGGDSNPSDWRFAPSVVPALRQRNWLAVRFSLTPTLGEKFAPVVWAAASGTANIKLSDIPVGKVIQVGQMKFVKVGADQYQAVNLCPTGSTYMAAYKGCVVKQTNFAYTGGEQTFTAPASGYYVLEVWGAQGGRAYSKDVGNYITGGYGGYSIGVVNLQKQKTLYVYVGGGGNEAKNGNAYEYTIIGNGYNGGTHPTSQYWQSGRYLFVGGGGGGATHVAEQTGLLKNLASYKDKIYVVAGGGGGNTGSNGVTGGSTSHDGIGGNGGGYIGNNGTRSVAHNRIGDGGTQTSGGTSENTYTASETASTFGAGCLPKADPYYSSSGGMQVGGGVGWYGGGCGTHSGGGGGSGYIGSSSLVSLTNFQKHMTCYECSTSTDVATYTISNTCVNANPVMDCAKTGNGAARITQLSVYLGI